MSRSRNAPTHAARIAAVLILLAAIAAPAGAQPPSGGPTGAAAAAGAGRPSGYVSEVLPNGLRVSILPDPSLPVVATQVWYHVGSANEEPKTRGFAHLFEHMMFGGTTKHSKRDYWQLHNDNGGDDNAYTSFDETVYVSELPPGPHVQVLEMEADRMVHLALTQENLDNEKRIVTEELRLGTENDPYSRMGTEILKKVLGEHPYALTPVGTKEDIAGATLEHAREFYESYYRPRNAHLVIVGPVDGPATLAEVRRIFGPLPAEGVTPPDVPELYGWKMPAKIDVTEDLPPIETAMVGYMLPSPTSNDHWAIEAMASLLTGGTVRPFERELVERRHRALMAETMDLEFRRGRALAFVSINLPYRREATAFRDVDEALAALGRFEWLTGESLAAVKRKMARRELGANYWAASLASRIGAAAWWQGDETLAFDRAARIERVSVAEVRAAFDRYIAGATPVRIYARPERVPVLVRLFGWLYPLLNR